MTAVEGDARMVAALIAAAAGPEAEPPSSAPGTSAGVRPGGPAPSPGSPPATRLERHLLGLLTDGLSPERRTLLARRWYDAGLPGRKTPEFSSDDAARATALVVEVRDVELEAEADPSGRRGAEDAGPGVEPGPATTTYDDPDEEPFE